VATTLYLIDDDDPREFKPRLATIVRDDVRVEAQRGVVVTINPPIEHAAGGPLGAAILVPRHKDVSIDDIRAGAREKPASVFVCRFEGDLGELPRQLTKTEVRIALWGLVSGSLDFGGRL